MGDGFQFFDIVLFAAIAGFLVLRLRSVLGRRTGQEQRRDPFAPPNAAGGPASPEKVIPLPPRGRGLEGTTSPAPATEPTARLRAADPGFDENAFLRGARGAFEIIVNAFAAGDTAALKPLLSRDVFESFNEAIAARIAARETLETTLMSIKLAEIVEATVMGSTVRITVKFVSDQVNITRAADGAILEGDANHIVEKTDFWTFSRALRSPDPNWTLIATHSP